MIPTQRPPSLTTGTPGSSCSRHEPHDLLDGRPRGRPSAGRVHDVAHGHGHRRVSLPARGPAGSAAIDVRGDHAVGPVAAARPRAARRARAARTPAQAAANGSSSLASIAPITPLRTSPVPAVASAGVAPGLIADEAVGPRDERVVALEHDDRARLRRRPRARGARRCALTSSLEPPSRRPSSPACGVSTVGAAALAQLAEALGVRVEPVGVEHERHVAAARRASRANSCAPARAAEPGPSTSAPPRSVARSTASAPAATCAPSSSGSARVIDLEQVHRERRLLGRRARSTVT